MAGAEEAKVLVRKGGFYADDSVVDVPKATYRGRRGVAEYLQSLTCCGVHPGSGGGSSGW